MKVLFFKQCPCRVQKQFLKNWVQKLGQAFYHLELISSKDKKKILYLVWVSKKEMKKINGKFRHIYKATDVLSFAPIEKEKCFGEVILCPEVITKKAQKEKLSPSIYTGYLIVHACLHLLGFDHKKENDSNAKKMYQIQDKIFQRLLSKH